MQSRLSVLAVILSFFVVLASSNIRSHADSFNGGAGVQTVNGLSGAVTVPVVCIQRTTTDVAVSSTDGTFSWTFPNTNCTFTATPNCFVSLAASNTNYVFAYPIRTATSATSVAFTETAALKILTISLGALTIWGPPPSGTTAAISCVQPM